MATVPRNKRETAALTAQVYGDAAKLVKAWAASGATIEECIERLEHHAWAVEFIAR